MLVGGLPYCQPSNLANYLPASTLALASPAVQQQACLDASEEADSFMRGRYTLPMVAVGNDVVMRVSHMACYHLMNYIGWPPSSSLDDNIKLRYWGAVGWPDKPGTGWFPGIQRQAVHPDVTPSVVPGQDPQHDIPQVESQPRRGWQQVRNGRSVVGGF